MESTNRCNSISGTKKKKKKMKKKKNVRMNMHAVLSDFAVSASMHGIPRIINAQSLPARVFWSLVCFGAFVMFIGTCANLLNQYFSYPKKVNVEIVQRPVPFPSVTVCNTDHLDLVVVDRLEKVIAMDAVNLTGVYVDEFQRQYLDYLTMTYPLGNGLRMSNEKGKLAYLELLSRLGFVANVGPELASKAGIKSKDFIINCRFMDEDCDIGETFLEVFDPYYFNCFTFQPQRILESKPSRLSGVEYGLSILLDSGCAGQLDAGKDNLPKAIPGMIESNPALVTRQGARVVIHSPNTKPHPTADGYDIPAGYSVSIGLRARENIRISLPHGNCTDTEEEREEDRSNFSYTLNSCQNECIQRTIMKTCGCIDNRMPLISNDNNNNNNPNDDDDNDRRQRQRPLPYCLQLRDPSFPDACRGDLSPTTQSPEGHSSSAAGDDFLQANRSSSDCKRMEGENIVRFYERMLCRREVYENMTTKNEDGLDSCACHPPCRDIVYDASSSLSMLPENRKENDAFYSIVVNFVEEALEEKKRILEKKHGRNYKDFVKRHISRVNVHIADSNIIKTTESPDYGLIRLVSDIGGQLGLWIGISVITLIEVVQLCADLVGIVMYHGTRLRSRDWKQELPKENAVLSTRNRTSHHHQRQEEQQQPMTTTVNDYDYDDDDETELEIDKMTTV